MKIIYCWFLLLCIGCTHTYKLENERVERIGKRPVTILLADSTIRTGQIASVTTNCIYISDRINDSIPLAEVKKIVYSSSWIGARDWAVLMPAGLYLVAALINASVGELGATFKAKDLQVIPGLMMTGAATGFVVGSKMILEPEKKVK